MRRHASLAGVFLAALLSACKVGPNFTPPHEFVPDRYSGAAPDAGAQPNPGAQPDAGAQPNAGASPNATADRTLPTGGEPQSFWWREFHDPELDHLIGEVSAGNLDLKVAYVRLVEARLQVLSARGQGLPSLDASASYKREQLGLAGILKSQGFSAASAPPQLQSFLSGVESPVNLWQLGFDASWEIDLFGRVRRSIEAAQAQGEQALESRNDLLVSLEAEVGQQYLQMRSAQVLRRIMHEEIDAQREVLRLTQDRHLHGLAGEAEVDSAQAQLSNLESELPEYEQTLATSRHALAVLCGQDPERFDDRFGTSGELPPLPAQVPVGVPSTLARRRPDIRGAEAALHAATAQIGVSVAQLFPDVSLSGTFGVRNLGTRYLLDWQSHFYTVGPTVSVPIFRGGQLTTNVRLSRAQAAEAALNYRKTVLGALQEVEDALSALEQDAARSSALRDTVAADQQAVRVDLDAFHHGLTTYITVLTVQLQTVQARQQLEQALLAQRTDLVRLYKALGGGWDIAKAPAGTSLPAVASPAR
jgi:NodT family efflux transporter outer membrane factor (OMF) lipoprotein